MTTNTTVANVIDEIRFNVGLAILALVIAVFATVLTACAAATQTHTPTATVTASQLAADPTEAEWMCTPDVVSAACNDAPADRDGDGQITDLGDEDTTDHVTPSCDSPQADSYATRTTATHCTATVR